MIVIVHCNTIISYIENSLGSEDTLRKPEFFGQYGKIAKIVINRNHPGNNGDPKRSTASAYITFVHPVSSDMYYVV